MKKILLNCLPPTDVNVPSASLSILKSFMLSNGFETEIKYWNFLLSLMSDYTQVEDTEIKIIPFISILNDQCNNEKGNNRIVSLLQELQPSYKIYGSNYYKDYLHNTKSRIFKIIQDELKKIDFNTVLLFGISSKFHQWIPGMILSDEIKKISPDTKIVVGGFGSKEAAREALKTCRYFDYAIWGEGEYPLLKLTEQLNNETNNFNEIPRLLYRDQNNIIESLLIKSDYLDFQNYIFPVYDDYINNYPYPDKKYQIRIPLNSIRACHWSKCKFCDYNHGYKYRERNPECVVKEIEHIAKNYEITTYSFVDNDIFGNLERFEKLLDLIIESKYRNEYNYIFWAEMIPNSLLHAGLIEKMAIAGFKHIFIGYDAISDSLLKKMNKSSSFSDNIFFVKYSLKYGITPVVNVIRGIHGETEEEVQESINNLHFLRFFYNDKNISFSQRYVTLVISTMTKFYSIISEDEKMKYDYNVITYLLPDYFSNHTDRFCLFRWKKKVLDNFREWEILQNVENYYIKNKFSYKILENKGNSYYTEYCNNEEISNIVFNEPDYIETLKIANVKVISYDVLKTKLKILFSDITDDRIKKVIADLKSACLLYSSNDYTSIVTVIDMK